MKIIPVTEDKFYIELEENLRLIYVNGVYEGFYNPNLSSVI